jgi:alkylation response protein AidB-like acyl-CoA dehydrogenase
MAQQIADKRDIDFVLYEQLGAENYKKTERYKGQNRKMFDMVVKEARNFAIKEILPLGEVGDRIGLEFNDNQVKVPENFHRVYKLLREAEYIAMSEDPEIGGQGLPLLIKQAVMDYIMGADFSFSCISMITHGAAKMIELFGTAKQKDIFLNKMYTGQWSGTMVLTEPEAGSDVGALTTTAVKNGDGTYSIFGNKIFISYGEHDLTENIIHPVLARIEGAPKGTKGISLFIVPKIWVNDDGTLGESNDVVCTSIEEKMGLHAKPTCQLTFGSKGQCRGILLGEVNKGMQVMFNMMNEARLAVGSLGLFNASSAYLYALNYARERVQGRDIADKTSKEAQPVNIIRHPDVRRMLLWMKAHTEGMRSLVYYVAELFDKEALASTVEEKEVFSDLIELLTPVIKSYCTDRGFECTAQAMQVYGGYGYTRDYPVERLMRDAKANSIYEGTNGIQSIDLLGRKLGMKKGAVFKDFLGEIAKVTAKAKQVDGLAELAERLESAAGKLGENAISIVKTANSPDVMVAFSFSLPFLDVMGDVIMAWMLLWRATIAKPALEKLVGDVQGEARNEKIRKNKNAAFYAGQVKSTEYFIQAILPITIGKMNAIGAGSRAAVDILESSFGA